jgi:hypothetical protein
LVWLQEKSNSEFMGWAGEYVYTRKSMQTFTRDILFRQGKVTLTFPYFN